MFNQKIDYYDIDIYNNIIITKALNIYKYLCNKYKKNNEIILNTFGDFNESNIYEVKLTEHKLANKKKLIYNNYNIKIFMYYKKSNYKLQGFEYKIIINYNNNIYCYNTCFYPLYYHRWCSPEFINISIKKSLLLFTYAYIVKNNKDVNKYLHNYTNYCQDNIYNKIYIKIYNNKIYKKSNDYYKFKKTNIFLKFKIILII